MTEISSSMDEEHPSTRLLRAYLRIRWLRFVILDFSLKATITVTQYHQLIVNATESKSLKSIPSHPNLDCTWESSFPSFHLCKYSAPSHDTLKKIRIFVGNRLYSWSHCSWSYSLQSYLLAIYFVQGQSSRTQTMQSVLTSSNILESRWASPPGSSSSSLFSHLSFLSSSFLLFSCPPPQTP